MLPLEYLEPFDAQELEWVIAGTPEIDMEDWKRNTVYWGGKTLMTFDEQISSLTQRPLAHRSPSISGTKLMPPFSQLLLLLHQLSLPRLPQ